MKSFNDFLQSPQMQRLLDKTAELSELNELLHAALTVELQGHYKVQSFAEGRLKLETESAVWATRIRYLTPSLVKELVKVLPRLKTVQCSVIPPVYKPTKMAKTPKSLSNNTKMLINATASSISDPKLRAALEKLGR